MLSDVGYHIQLNNVDNEKNETLLFPVNTVEDVIVNEDCDTLIDFLPTVENDISNPTEKSPLTAIQTGEEDIPDSVLANLVMG